MINASQKDLDKIRQYLVFEEMLRKISSPKLVYITEDYPQLKIDNKLNYFITSVLMMVVGQLGLILFIHRREKFLLYLGAIVYQLILGGLLILGLIGIFVFLFINLGIFKTILNSYWTFIGFCASGILGIYTLNELANSSYESIFLDFRRGVIYFYVPAILFYFILIIYWRGNLLNNQDMRKYLQYQNIAKFSSARVQDVILKAKTSKNLEPQKILLPFAYVHFINRLIVAMIKIFGIQKYRAIPILNFNDLGIQSLTNFFDASAFLLDLRHNQITKLFSTDLINCDVNFLDLRHNPIEFIDPDFLVTTKFTVILLTNTNSLDKSFLLGFKEDPNIYNFAEVLSTSFTEEDKDLTCKLYRKVREDKNVLLIGPV